MMRATCSSFLVGTYDGRNLDVLFETPSTSSCNVVGAASMMSHQGQYCLTSLFTIGRCTHCAIFGIVVVLFTSYLLPFYLFSFFPFTFYVLHVTFLQFTFLFFDLLPFTSYVFAFLPLHCTIYLLPL